MVGNSGAGVKTLQKSLNFCTGLTIDGSYGAKTRDAVMKVQSERGELRPACTVHKPAGR
ncbi:peptidoglycan-binding domain-containing protein [Streptomyces viridochromogenes]|uniref:peptidoglycan-binding domain-containing protein n=1 Tax=Streptomyces viridochromogenes TaxID=1938 RepID=UPI00099D6E12